MHGFRAGRKSPIFGVWAAPAAVETFQQVGREAAHLLEGFARPPGAPGPPISAISARPKNYDLKTLVYWAWGQACHQTKFKGIGVGFGAGCPSTGSHVASPRVLAQD